MAEKANESLNLSNSRDPPLIRAARMFQDNIRVRDTKVRGAAERNVNLEKELNALQARMDNKMNELQGLQDLSAKTKPAGHILETVMGELEQRNLELSSLLKASERSRVEMEGMLKEQNEELTTLRANTLIMKTLEEEVTGLNTKKDELNERISELESDLLECRRHEQSLNQKITDVAMEREQLEQGHNSRLLDMNSKLVFAEDQIKEKEMMIERTEMTAKELFEKCNQLGTSNTDVKQELLHCLESGKKLKDLNTKLHFCKDYLEQQVDQLIKELKSSRGLNEQMKLEMSNSSREKQNFHKQVVLLEDQHKQTLSEMQLMKEKLSSVEKHLHEYEAGSVRSACVIAEIHKEKESHDMVKISLERQIRDLEGELKIKEDQTRNCEIQNRKIKTDMLQLNSKLEYFQQHFIEKQELQKLKSDLEIKYKLDLNTQLQKVSNMFEQEQNELIDAMKNSVNQRNDSELNTAITPDAIRRSNAANAFYRSHS